MKLAPSLLSADFGNLTESALSVEALADFFHFDVMDGHFVPNLTFGPPVVNSLRPVLSRPFDIHLMIDHPLVYAPRFHVHAGDIITFHVESRDDPHETIAAIRAGGAEAGITLRPDTALDTVFPLLDHVSLVLVMSVEPGFGGQSFLRGALDRIRRLRSEIGERELILSVDGGIHPGNVRDVVDAGADLIVAGSAVFGAPDPLAAMRALLEGT